MDALATASPAGFPLQTIVSRRWGVRCCQLIDRPVFEDGLARLLESDEEPQGARDALRRLMADAAGMARDSEEIHWSESAWPAGLAADFAALLQTFETFEAQTGSDRVRAAAATEDALRRLRTGLDGYRLPSGGCATWRLLCVLGRKIDAGVQRRIDDALRPA